MNVVQLAAHRDVAVKDVSHESAARDDWLYRLALAVETYAALQGALRVTLQTTKLIKQIAEQPAAYSPVYLCAVEASLERELVALRNLFQALQSDQCP